MKDYKQVTESVFKKAEQRIAEKKRRSAIARRNAIAASGLAAVLFVALLQNDGIRSAIKSLPKLASSGWWTNDERKSSHTTTTTATTGTTTAKTNTSHTATETTTTETSSTETSSTTTSTTTTTGAATKKVTTTAEPDPKPKSPLEGMIFFALQNAGTPIRSVTDDIIELETGMRIGLEYGNIDYRGFFKAGEEIKYVANFAYDAENDIYYYIDGFLDHPEPRQGHLYFDEPITEMDFESYKKYYNFDDPGQTVFDGAIPIDYNDILAIPSFTFQEGSNAYKIEARNIKIIDRFDNHYFTTEDGQKWFFSRAENMSDKQLVSIQNGDVISFIGYFFYYDFDKALTSMNLIVKIESQAEPHDDYQTEQQYNSPYSYYDDYSDDYYDDYPYDYYGYYLDDYYDDHPYDPDDHYNYQD